MDLIQFIKWWLEVIILDLPYEGKVGPSDLHHRATSPCRETSKKTNKLIESHHNNGQFYYSFSHYTVHAATSCMGEIKNNRLFNNYFNSTLGGKTGKNDEEYEEYMEEKIRFSSNFFLFSIWCFFVDVVFTRFSQIHSVNW